MDTWFWQIYCPGHTFRLHIQCLHVQISYISFLSILHEKYFCPLSVTTCMEVSANQKQWITSRVFLFLCMTLFLFLLAMMKNNIFISSSSYSPTVTVLALFSYHLERQLSSQLRVMCCSPSFARCRQRCWWLDGCNKFTMKNRTKWNKTNIPSLRRQLQVCTQFAIQLFWVNILHHTDQKPDWITHSQC